MKVPGKGNQAYFQVKARGQGGFSIVFHPPSHYKVSCVRKLEVKHCQSAGKDVLFSGAEF